MGCRPNPRSLLKKRGKTSQRSLCEHTDKSKFDVINAKEIAKELERSREMWYNAITMTMRWLNMEEIRSVADFEKKIKRVLITEDEIKEAIKKAGKEIDKIYDGRPILLVSILKGAFVFMADLCRAISVPCEVGFMCAKSYYQGTVSTGVVQITMDLDQDVSGYHVVIAEDIIDTGRTLNDVVKMLKARNPISLHVVTLLDKPSRRLVDFKADLSLFTIPDHFVIGYGLDCGEYYRNLPYIAEYGE